MNNADNSDSYELNIRAMEDNVIVKKEDIFTALEKINLLLYPLTQQIHLKDSIFKHEMP